MLIKNNILPHHRCQGMSRIIFMVVLFTLSMSWGQTLILPEAIQAALMEKVLKYDSRLGEIESIKMVIVYKENRPVNAERLSNALPRKWQVKLVSDLSTIPDLADYDLVYFMPDTEGQSEIPKRHAILTVTCIPAQVEMGRMSVAFGLENDKPKIYINIASLKSEGHSFASEFLRIVEVSG